MDVCGLKKGFEVEFIYNQRLNPGTKIVERNRRNWIVVYGDGFYREVVYVKRVRQFHRGWMKELDPFIKGSRVSIPLIHDGNQQDQSKVALSFGFSQKMPVPPIIPHHKGAFHKNKIKHNHSEYNAKKYMPKPVVLPNQMTDFLETIEREKKEAEAARLKAEMDAKNAMIRKHREHMLKHLRKMGVVPGVKGESIDVFEVEETS